MKHKNIINLMLLSTAFIFAQFANAEDTGSINVVIEGLKNNDGTVRIALANSKENHPLDTTAFQVAETDINEKTATAIFENIPYGDYSI